MLRVYLLNIQIKAVEMVAYRNGESTRNGESKSFLSISLAFYIGFPKLLIKSSTVIDKMMSYSNYDRKIIDIPSIKYNQVLTSLVDAMLQL